LHSHVNVQNLNDQNGFLHARDILAEMAGVSVRSLSERKVLRLISIHSGAICLNQGEQG